MADGRDPSLTWNQQRQSLCCALLTGAWLLAGVTVARRLSGDAGPLPEAAACFTGLAAMAVSVLCITLPEIAGRLNRAQRCLLVAMATLPAAVLGLALLPSESSAGMACLLGVFLIAVGVGTLSDSLRERHATNDGEKPRRTNEPARAAANPETELLSCDEAEMRSAKSSIDPAGQFPDTVELEDSRDEDTIDGCDTSATEDVSANDLGALGDSTVHWMNRSVADGYETIEGGLRVEIEAGSRQAAVHLSFVPPFALTPELESEPLDGSDVRMRVTAVYPYGARFEVIRSGDLSEPASIELGYAAFAAATADAA